MVIGGRVVPEPDDFGGRTPVEKRMMMMMMATIKIATTAKMIVQRVFFHHILRCTRRDVFLNVDA